MRKNFGAKPMCYPMPVYIIGTYGADGTPNAMNAAWGGISEEAEISICISADVSNWEYPSGLQPTPLTTRSKSQYKKPIYFA